MAARRALELADHDAEAGAGQQSRGSGGGEVVDVRAHEAVVLRRQAAEIGDVGHLDEQEPAGREVALHLGEEGERIEHVFEHVDDGNEIEAPVELPAAINARAHRPADTARGRFGEAQGGLHAGAAPPRHVVDEVLQEHAGAAADVEHRAVAGRGEMGGQMRLEPRHLGVVLRLRLGDRHDAVEELVGRFLGLEAVAAVALLVQGDHVGFVEPRVVIDEAAAGAHLPVPRRREIGGIDIAEIFVVEILDVDDARALGTAQIAGDGFHRGRSSIADSSTSSRGGLRASSASRSRARPGSAQGPSPSAAAKRARKSSRAGLTKTVL